MKKHLIEDAVSLLDDDLLNEHLEKKRSLNKKQGYTAPRKFRMNPKGWLALAACFALIISVVLFMARGDKPDDGGEIPDKGHIFRLGEVCENDDWNGAKHSIVFTDVYITNDIAGNEGNYIVFSGEINTTAFSFPIDNSNRFYLDLRMIENPTSWEVNKATFEKELSSELSSTNLLYNGEEGSMNGVFSLVFSIGDENFDLIKQKTPNTLNFSISQISLKIGVTWCGGTAYFCFDTSDIRYVEKIK